MVEDVNSVLNCGEVADLFDLDETNQICMELKSAAIEAAVPDTRQDVWKFFLQRARERLHIALALSPAAKGFRHRCRANPALVSCTTIDWFEVWDPAAMRNVAVTCFEHNTAIQHPTIPTKELKEKLADACVAMHHRVEAATDRFWNEHRRRHFVTPASYMLFVQSFMAVLQRKRSRTFRDRDRLSGGLGCLTDANTAVGQMQVELVELGPRIEAKARDADTLLLRLQDDQKAVDEVRQMVSDEEAVMRAEAEVVENYAVACEQDLGSVLPALYDSVQALDALDKADVAEIRVYTAPPVFAQRCMAAVCTLLQEPTDWPHAKTVLKDPNFLARLISLDRDKLPQSVFANLRKITSEPGFDPANIGRTSVACKSLCRWVLALEMYNDVYNTVKPKKRKVEEAKAALAMARQNLAKKQASLATIEQKMVKLRSLYERSKQEQKDLYEKKVKTGLRLERASQLSVALADERVRWAAQIDVLDGQMAALVTASLIVSAVVAYCGPFTAGLRRDLLAEWRRIVERRGMTFADDFDIIKAATQPTRVLEWQNKSLPRDEHSVQNAVILENSLQWPMLVDPQHQALVWIKQMEGSRLKIFSVHDTHLLRNMEQAVRVGSPVLLMGVQEQLDPVLAPILRRETTVRGNQEIMVIGDSEIEYNRNFQLYLVTELARPQFPPAVCIQVTVIDFGVTPGGLTEQLLSLVVQNEQPALEAERVQLLVSIATDLTSLTELENKSLDLLQNTKGHLLDDEDLISTLQNSKVKAAEVTEHLALSEQTEKQLNSARQEYLPVATRAATLYFIVSDLGAIDVMYQFSLAWYQAMFQRCINLSQPLPGERTLSARRALSTRQKTRSAKRRLQEALETARSVDQDAEASPAPSTSKSPRRVEFSKENSGHEPDEPTELQDRMEAMMKRLTSTLYDVVSMSLFAEHQSLFSLLLCARIQLAETASGRYGDESTHRMTALEWSLLLHSDALLARADKSTLASIDGLTDKERLLIQTKNLRAPVVTTSESTWNYLKLLEMELPTAFGGLIRALRWCPEQLDTIQDSDDPYQEMSRTFETPTVVSRPMTSQSTVVDAENNETTVETTECEVDIAYFPWARLTLFQRLLIIKAIKSEALVDCCRRFVVDCLGERYTKPSSMDMHRVFARSTFCTPIVFILSPGSDPYAHLTRFANEVRGSTLHLDSVSLGRGQGPRAEELILKAQTLRGRWVFLQNCHLAASWMPRLQLLVEKMNQPDAEIDRDFRLFLSSKPDASFPIPVLQASLKLTVEPPQGLTARLRATLAAFDATTRANFDAATPAWRRLFYGLCFFHSLVHERKKFGSLGWNTSYEFNQSDLEVSLLQLDQLVHREQKDSEQQAVADSIPWQALNFLTGEINYGGRVTDDLDRRCLLAMMSQFYSREAIADGYAFSTDGLYRGVPAGVDFDGVVRLVDALPDVDSPAVFGMDVNASRSTLKAAALGLIESVVAVEPQLIQQAHAEPTATKESDATEETVTDDTSEGKTDVVQVPTEATAPKPKAKTSDQIVTEQCDVLMALLPASIGDGEAAAVSGIPTLEWTLAELAQRSPSRLPKEVVAAAQDALLVVLRHETTRYNQLLTTVRLALKQLKSALAGELAMSDQLEQVSVDILNNRLPAAWRQISYITGYHRLASWATDLRFRCDCLQNWADHTTRYLLLKVPDLVARQIDLPAHHLYYSDPLTQALPRAFKLSNYFFPSGLLTAVLQKAARHKGVPVDSLDFAFEVQGERFSGASAADLVWRGDKPPEDGVIIAGLFADSAKWCSSSGRLIEVGADDSRYQPLPDIHFDPVQISATALRQRKSVADADDGRGASAGTASAGSATDGGESGKRRQTSYSCPLYQTTERRGILSSTGASTNFVCFVHLPTTRRERDWILRGAAMVTQLEN